jgi:hypothetical protein
VEAGQMVWKVMEDEQLSRLSLTTATSTTVFRIEKSCCLPAVGRMTTQPHTKLTISRRSHGSQRIASTSQSTSFSLA